MLKIGISGILLKANIRPENQWIHDGCVWDFDFGTAINE